MKKFNLINSILIGFLVAFLLGLLSQQLGVMIFPIVVILLIRKAERTTLLNITLVAFIPAMLVFDILNSFVVLDGIIIFSSFAWTGLKWAMSPQKEKLL